MGTYNRWLRNALADRIEANGGYHAARSEQYPLSWNVGLYNDLNGVEEVVAALIKHEHVLNEADLMLRCPDYDTRLTPAAYARACEFAAEDMRRSLDDDEGLHMWGPETAKRYGFDYVGRGAERPFVVKFELCGRGGKHLCLVMFEGLLAGRSIDLADTIRQSDGCGHFTNVRCRQLMGMLDEWDRVFSREAVAAEYEYQQAWHFANHLELG